MGEPLYLQKGEFGKGASTDPQGVHLRIPKPERVYLRIPNLLYKGVSADPSATCRVYLQIPNMVCKGVSADPQHAMYRVYPRIPNLLERVYLRIPNLL